MAKQVDSLVIRLAKLPNELRDAVLEDVSSYTEKVLCVMEKAAIQS